MEIDICIIGAGPAGIFASIAAAESRAKTLVIERNTNACRKLLHTGGERCNLTHTGSVEDFVKAYGVIGRFLRHSLYEFSSDDLRRYFADRGVETKAQNDGCIFPVSERAADISKVLINHAKELSVQFMYDKKVTGIKKISDGFEISADNQKVESKKLIIATGGLSWPFTGSTGDGYNFAKTFNHTIIVPRASLCNLIVSEKWVGEIEGIGLDKVVIRAKAGDKKIAVSGPIMFTDDGISGPVVLELSRLITDSLPNENNPIKANIDLLPEYELKQLDKEIALLCAKNPKKDVINALAGFLQKSLLANLLKQINVSANIPAGQFTKTQRAGLVKTIKELSVSIAAAGPIAEATVTRGGVCEKEINQKTMESKLCPGLYFCGEVINADGPCGGYNLQIAFSTGHLAGWAAAQS